jgi:hypothetical protein
MIRAYCRRSLVAALTTGGRRGVTGGKGVAIVSSLGPSSTPGLTTDTPRTPRKKRVQRRDDETASSSHLALDRTLCRRDGRHHQPLDRPGDDSVHMRAARFVQVGSKPCNCLLAVNRFETFSA